MVYPTWQAGRARQAGRGKAACQWMVTRGRANQRRTGLVWLCRYLTQREGKASQGEAATRPRAHRARGDGPQPEAAHDSQAGRRRERKTNSRDSGRRGGRAPEERRGAGTGNAREREGEQRAEGGRGRARRPQNTKRPSRHEETSPATTASKKRARRGQRGRRGQRQDRTARGGKRTARCSRGRRG